jgi:hypothetical protein
MKNGYSVIQGDCHLTNAMDAAVPRGGHEAGDFRTNRFSWIRGKPDSFMHVSSEPNSTQIIKLKVMNRHFRRVNYGLALNAWNTVHRNCRYICDSWIYRQGSMDNRKMDYYHLYYPRDNFTDIRKTSVLTFLLKKSYDERVTRKSDKKEVCRNVMVASTSCR